MNTNSLRDMKFRLYFVADDGSGILENSIQNQGRCLLRIKGLYGWLNLILNDVLVLLLKAKKMETSNNASPASESQCLNRINLQKSKLIMNTQNIKSHVRYVSVTADFSYCSWKSDIT
jgi:hypothetical protein